jgi:hypothetical protein
MQVIKMHNDRCKLLMQLILTLLTMQSTIIRKILKKVIGSQIKENFIKSGYDRFIAISKILLLGSKNQSKDKKPKE